MAHPLLSSDLKCVIVTVCPALISGHLPEAGVHGITAGKGSKTALAKSLIGIFVEVVCALQSFRTHIPEIPPDVFPQLPLNSRTPFHGIRVLVAAALRISKEESRNTSVGGRHR